MGFRRSKPQVVDGFVSSDINRSGLGDALVRCAAVGLSVCWIAGCSINMARTSGGDRDDATIYVIGFAVIDRSKNANDVEVLVSRGLGLVVDPFESRYVAGAYRLHSVRVYRDFEGVVDFQGNQAGLLEVCRPHLSVQSDEMGDLH